MSDLYTSLVSSSVGSSVAARLGLPRPVELRRWSPGDPIAPGPVLLAPLPAARFSEDLRQNLSGAGVSLVSDSEAGAAQRSARLGGVVVDASGITGTGELEGLRSVLAPAVRQLVPGGRVVVVGTDPATLRDPRHRACQRGLEGFVRSLGKELRAGATANLVLARGDAGQAVCAAVQFYLSGRSAYVDGQVLVAGPGHGEWPTDLDLPLAGRTALVTGAARGIGAVVARVLARDGAKVVAVDMAAAGDALAAVANEVAGVAVQLDITRPDAGRRIAEHPTVAAGLDIVVHNAGITRDKLLVNLDEARWNSVLAVNLESQLRIDEFLLADGGPLREGARLVSVSSMAGIAGNRGQTNYAASKAGIIGMVTAQADALAARGMTYNAVAPGFIETAMTARIPFATREIGRRLNSLSQGGRPEDVAEAIGFFAHPAAAGITGQVLRVCGQSLLGA